MTLPPASSSPRMDNVVRRSEWISRTLAWVLIAAVVVQFYTAGLGIFGGASFLAHRIIGSGSALIALLLLGSVLVARRGRAVGLFALGCALLTVFQPILIFVIRPRLPEIAAIHPVVGLVIGILAWLIATAGSRFRPGRTSGRSQPSTPAVAME